MRSEAAVRHLVGTIAGHARAQSLAPDTPLGSTGLGLDSVSLVELLLACEAAFGIPFPETVMAAGPLTLRRLAAHIDGEPGAAR